MTDKSAATVNAIYRYPVKGLTPEELSDVTLKAGETLPFDRVYAIENGAGRFRAEAPKHLPKVNFLMLMRNARMAKLKTRFNNDGHILTIERDGHAVAEGSLATPAGRAIIAQFLNAYFADDLRGSAHIVSAPGHSFSDVSARCLHIVNLASLRELERITGQTLSPLRFRPNLILDSDTPWQEFNWLDQTLITGDAKVSVFKRTERCAAIDVNPDTGERDTDLLKQLARHWGHTDFGVYARVTTAGDVKPGAPVVVTA